MSRHSQLALKHLLVRDGQRVAGIGFRNSVLIQVLRELDYISGITYSGHGPKSTPQLAQILLFCSAIDLSGRILNRRIPKSNESGHFFASAAKEWYGMNDEEATALWKIRNFTSHQFNPTLNSRVMGGIAPAYTVIDLNSTNGVPLLFTGSMTSTIERAMSIMWHELSNRPLKEKKLDAEFMSENCFFYSKHPPAARSNHEPAVLSSLYYKLKKLAAN